ncbi:hypothetical protein GCM10022399_11640 [Terrabacter ginsenosidimutans]|uniref:Ferredoxin n=1 Tax=Terrabacter ginsenosidimutans TaxID=490575 RepID=A0ABP7CYT2_9MICO
MSTPGDRSGAHSSGRSTGPSTDRAEDHTRRRLGLAHEPRVAVDRVVGEDGRELADTAVRLCPARALYLR